MAFQIGQYRYTGGGCTSAVSANLGYQNTSISAAGTSTLFKDVLISPTGAGTTFVKGADYYLSVAIPQDMNYDITLNLKLIKNESGIDTVYQFLKSFTINRGGSGENLYNVVLYETSTGDVQPMIPLEYVAGKQNIKDAIYFQPATTVTGQDKYYLGTGGTKYIETTNYNNVTILASWRQETGTNKGILELTFRPVEDGFSGILLEMYRTPEDYNIQRVNESGEMEYGRVIDINNVEYSLLRINNLVDQMNMGGTLSRIGVWGHPGLIMTINGEEIKVGPSSYYELDVLPIVSLGIVAGTNDFNNNFTIDYAYENKSETTLAEGV